MICDCGNDKAFALRKYAGDDHFSCDRCGGVSGTWMPDVFYKSGIDTGLFDERGQSLTFFSRRHKASYMREKGIEEAGDRVRGARASPQLYGKPSDRRAVTEAVEKAKAQIKSGNVPRHVRDSLIRAKRIAER